MENPFYLIVYLDKQAVNDKNPFYAQWHNY